MSRSILNSNWISLIAIFGLGVLSFTSCGSNNSEAEEEKPLAHLLDRYLEPYPDELTALVDPAKSPEVIAAMEAYNAGRYEEAIGLFPNHAQSIEQAGYVQLYKGISEILAGKEYDAFQTLQNIRSMMGKPFEISNWYLVMNYVGFNNVFEARRKLESIIEAEAYPTEKAKALLNDLPE